MKQSRDLLLSLYSLAMVVEARDAYTGGHLWRVSRFSHLLAKTAGLSDKESALIALGGFLHDLGKVGVPDAILNKKDKLTDEEYAVIKNHPQIGADLLTNHPLANLAMDAVFMHHETPDGKGYPQGLSKEAIPTVAKIVGITDAFDAMTSSRPYRQGMPIARAMQIIGENLGTQFDADLGRVFIQLAETDALTHIVGHSEPGIPLQSCNMCGPIIPVRRRSKQGDAVYCPSCTSEYSVNRTGSALSLTPTGKQVRAAALKHEVDIDLIGELLSEVSPYVFIEQRTGNWLSRMFS